MQELYDLAKENPHEQGMDGYVFWTWKMANKPVEHDIFLRDLRSALVKIGMGEASAKLYTFHGWRHYYTSYMMDRITEQLLQKQTGHKTLSMLKHYGDHLLAGDRERVRAAQVEIFAGLLPEGSGEIESMNHVV
jgi:integrase